MNLRQRHRNSRYLDRTIPLQGASHADVIGYTVEVPLRYAECRARLVDGRTVRFANPRQFEGWLGYGRNPSLLFRCGRRRIIVQTGHIMAQTFIARDGGQVTVNRWLTRIVRLSGAKQFARPAVANLGGRLEQATTN